MADTRDNETKAYHKEMQRLQAIRGGNGEPRKYRMPLARVVELLLTKPQRQAAETVTISRNAKGDYQFGVEAVAQEGETLAEATTRAQEIIDTLDGVYARSRTQEYDRKTLAHEKAK